DLMDKAAPSSKAPNITREEIEYAIKSLQNNKAAGIDNIPAELIKHGGEDVTTALLDICNKILTTGEWPQEWTKSILILIPKKVSNKCSEYRTVSLISHASKVMLKFLQRRIEKAIESTLDDAQAGFRANRSTAEQVCNLRVIGEKYIEHQMAVHCNFIDYKKAFDRHRSGYFKCGVGVRQGCILSPMLFNAFLEEIISRSLLDFEGGVLIHGREINNLRFADDIALITSKEQELEELTRKLDETSRKFGMEISAEKSKLMFIDGDKHTRISTDIEANGGKLEQVSQFKYLGCTIAENGKSTKELKIRITVAQSALKKLGTIWKSNNISVAVKQRLLRAIVCSVLLYGCEEWTFTEEMEKRLRAFEFRCYRRLLRVTFRDRKTNV
ncbi:uncharacterized protein LOC134789360, partial [Penaeus indicus]|uniref:uncharacterized protein LOC134789360 n=1 Tax=Penaeus indicus TaxID=29960 RepID=UPI00300C11EB